MFFPLAAGEEHAAKAVAAAIALLRSTGHEDAGGPWLPMGAGVHTGTAWVGALDDAVHVELTAVGDAVNVAARLASVASAGEILLSADSARGARGRRGGAPDRRAEGQIGASRDRGDQRRTETRANRPVSRAA